MKTLFVTGKLAEPALRQTLAEVAPRLGLEYEVAALNISVAALMTPAWIARHLRVPPGIARLMIPGYCDGDLAPLEELGVPVEVGPKDLLDLPHHLGQPSRPALAAHDIEILAEINHASRLSAETLVQEARRLQAEGADLIDLGCTPGETWTGIGDAVRRLRDHGLRVSVDSFNVGEIELATRAGAELVLSVNQTNLAAAPDWGCEVVVIPDDPRTLAGLDRTIEQLETWRVPFRIDPILEPIGLGFAHSLGRYLDVRRRWPTAQMLMGIGNLTEMTDADSAGINVLLAGFCQEVGIRSVLTTQVINWARTSVRELDLARRLVHHACAHRMPAKQREPRLVLLRDPRLRTLGEERLAQLARAIKDRNFRLFAEEGLLHLMNGGGYWKGTDPFTIFQEVLRTESIDAAHAFYLGYEMAKAVTALTLGKNYTQDQALEWGFLTRPETTHRDRERRRTDHGPGNTGECS